MLPQDERLQGIEQLSLQMQLLRPVCIVWPSDFHVHVKIIWNLRCKSLAQKLKETFGFVKNFVQIWQSVTKFNFINALNVYMILA
jgi:hypothetical protein